MKLIIRKTDITNIFITDLNFYTNSADYDLGGSSYEK